MLFGLTLLKDWLGETQTHLPLLTALTGGICSVVHRLVEFVLKEELEMKT